MSSPARLGWRFGTLIVVVAGILALSFCLLLARYWQFYHMSGGGAMLGLAYIVAPVSIALAMGAGMLVARSLSRRGARAPRAALGAVGLVTLMFGALFALELWRTSAARGGEGAGAGDLTPFFVSLVKRP